MKIVYYTVIILTIAVCGIAGQAIAEEKEAAPAQAVEAKAPEATIPVPAAKAPTAPQLPTPPSDTPGMTTTSELMKGPQSPDTADAENSVVPHPEIMENPEAAPQDEGQGKKVSVEPPQLTDDMKKGVGAPLPPEVAREAADAEAKMKKGEAPIPISKEDTVAYLKELLANRQDIMINGIAVVKNEQGTDVTYNGKKLEDLDEETLRGLQGQVGQQVSMRNLERLQRQLRDLKQMEDRNRSMRTQYQPKTYAPQRVPPQYKPPYVPKLPKTGK